MRTVRVNGFFAKYPSVPCHLRTLRLYNATFTETEMKNLIGNACTQLRYLYVFQCDTGLGKSFRIDAPNSALSKLEIFSCHSKQAEIVCLPKLELLISGHWSPPYLPLALGYVPCLKEVGIYYSAVLPGTIQAKRASVSYPDKHVDTGFPRTEGLATAGKTSAPLSI